MSKSTIQQIDYTKVNIKLAEASQSICQALNSIFRDKEKLHIATKKTEEFLADVFLEKLGEDVLYNSMMFALNKSNTELMLEKIYKNKEVDR